MEQKFNFLFFSLFTCLLAPMDESRAQEVTPACQESLQWTLSLLKQQRAPHLEQVAALKRQLAFLSSRAIELAKNQKHLSTTSFDYKKHRIAAQLLARVIEAKKAALQKENLAAQQLAQLLAQKKEEADIETHARGQKLGESSIISQGVPEHVNFTDQPLTQGVSAFVLKKKPSFQPRPGLSFEKQTEKPFVLPVLGKIIRTYKNPAYGPSGKDYGILLEPGAVGPVVAPVSGSITFSGEFPPYGAVIMIQAENDQDIFLSNVGEPLVTQKDYVHQGDPISIIPRAPKSQVYIEVRDKNQIALDPKIWLDKEISEE